MVARRSGRGSETSEGEPGKRGTVEKLRTLWKGLCLVEADVPGPDARGATAVVRASARACVETGGVLRVGDCVGFARRDSTTRASAYVFVSRSRSFFFSEII